LLALAGALLLALAIGRSAAPDVGAQTGTTISLYDGSSGVTPDAESATAAGPWWTFATFNAQQPIGGVTATQTAQDGYTTLDSTADLSIYGGYVNYTQDAAFVNPDFPDLDRSSGYTLAFRVRLTSEEHSSDSRAGFSVLALSSDVAAGTDAAIKLGFQDGRVFAQGDDPLFEAAEETTGFNPVGTEFIDYELTVQGDSYTLRADGQTILSGPLRDYTPFENTEIPQLDPYETPNTLFFGDNFISARASVDIASIALTTNLQQEATATSTPEEGAATATSTLAATATSTITATATTSITATATSTLAATATATATPGSATATATSTTMPLTVTATATPDAPLPPEGQRIYLPVVIGEP
jgi:hypothetical protein